MRAPLPPGPKASDIPRELRALKRRKWRYPDDLRDRYGDVVRLPIPFLDAVVVNDPDLLRPVHLTNAAGYERSVVTETMRVQGSPHHASWFDGRPEEWARGRRLLQPNFTQRGLVGFGRLFTDVIVEEVEKWRPEADTGRPFEMQEMFKTLALRVLYNALFSRRLDDREMEPLLEALNERMVATTIRTLMYPMPAWVPRPHAKSGAHADAWLDRHLAEIVAERRANPTDAHDVLDLLLAARYDDGTPLEDEKTRTEMLFLVIGGHETTASALAWVFALLASHPEAAKRVHAEVDAVDVDEITPAHFAALPFTRACFDEALRLQGGLVFNPKRATVDDEIGGYRIPAGTTVMQSNVTLQRDPRFWGAQAERFDPDRWLDGRANPADLEVFGRGQRMCMGKRLAYLEGVLTIATAFQRFTFSSPAGWRAEHEYRMSMGVKGGVPLLLESR
ncbi:MAG TPA: cytochrome P450 [Nocardioidaceae bacterium]|nr:cytochrome P450 [Nocardioidaceae bacterium]